jgi:hypothetical protein
LFVEIPLIQRFILYLGQPVYATAVVLFALLTGSGLGSVASTRLAGRGRWIALTIAALLLVYPSLLGALFLATLGLPFAARLLLAACSLAPLGFLLGIPFPWALRLVGQAAPGFTPWAWAANGCASVVSSVLAAMLAVSTGFSVVLFSAVLAYGAAWVIALALPSPSRPKITARV